MSTLTNQSFTINSRVSIAAGIPFSLNVPTCNATIIAINSDEYTIQFDNGTITTVYTGDMTLIEEPEKIQIIEEVKDTAKKIRATLKEAFPGVNFQVKTQNKTILLRWNDFPVLEEMEQFLGTFKTNYDESAIAYKVCEFDLNREFTREYENKNANWHRERRYHTLKWEPSKVKVEPNGIVSHAKVNYKGDKVEVNLSTNKGSNVVTFDYKKSWSHRKYVDKALEFSGMIPGGLFSYGWEM